MRINLLENQINLIMKSLENYTKVNPEKLQLINATYESLLSQLVSSKQDVSSDTSCNQNVIQM